MAPVDFRRARVLDVSSARINILRTRRMSHRMYLNQNVNGIWYLSGEVVFSSTICLPILGCQIPPTGTVPRPASLVSLHERQGTWRALVSTALIWSSQEAKIS